MVKLVGFSLMLGGVAGLLYSWICRQKSGQRQIAEIICFLRKSIFVMETEKVKVADYFVRYQSCYSRENMGEEEHILEDALHEIAKRLSTNNYPNGQTVWEEVFREEEQNWAIDQDAFQIILQIGNGFFGRSREENISFLNQSVRELEKQLDRMKEKDAGKRKVWVPVGLLGTAMLAILFL